jgi:hypothetical protein
VNKTVVQTSLIFLAENASTKLANFVQISLRSFMCQDELFNFNAVLNVDFFFANLNVRQLNYSLL